MNIYRSGDSNHRKPVLRPLTPTRDKRPIHQLPTSDSSRQPDSSDPIRQPGAAEHGHTPAVAAQESPDSDSPSRQSAPRSLFNRSLRVPVWAAVLAVLLMIAVPSALIVTRVNAPQSSAPDNVVEPDTSPEEEPDAAPEDTAQDLDEIFDGELFEDIDWDRPEPPARSPRQEYLASQGVSPDDHNVRYRAEEIEQLQRELEAIQRNSAMLRSLAREQSGDLSSVYSSLEATENEKDGELEDLQERIEELDERVQTVDEIARELREMLDLPEPESGIGGPAESLPDNADPWLVLRSDIVSIEQRSGGLVLSLEEVNAEIQERLAEQEEAEMASAQSAEPDVEYNESTPSGWPIDGPLTSRFGMRDSPFGSGSEMHTGVDISAPQGTSVRATGGGTVQTAGQQGGYGLLVVIDHGGGVSTWYGHNSRVRVNPGQSVNAGDVISEVGSTGMSTGPHVHYEIRINDSPQDPLSMTDR